MGCEEPAPTPVEEIEGRPGPRIDLEEAGLLAIHQKVGAAEATQGKSLDQPLDNGRNATGKAR